MFSKDKSGNRKSKYDEQKTSPLSSSTSTQLKNQQKKTKQMPLKYNRISTPEVQSQSITTNSDTAENSSIEMNVFLARGKASVSKKRPDITSDDVTDISNSNSGNESSEPSENGTSSKLYETERSQTDFKSYREKLKERFRNVKQKSYKKLGKTSLRKFKNKTQDLISLNKCIENLKTENFQIDQQLKAREHYQYIGNGGEVSSAEKYQFFCESLPPKNIKMQTEVIKTVDEVKEEMETRNIENQMCDGSTELVVNKKAESLKELLKKSYEVMTWKPHSKKLFEQEFISRNLPEEGCYVTQPPKMPNRHLYQLQQRLHATEYKNWFDTSGQIVFDEENYSSKSYRPDNYADVASFDVNYQKATVNVPTALSTISISKKLSTLDINIQSIRFSCHPLFSLEHIYQEELIYHFDTHKHFKRNNKREKLNERLQALRKTKAEINNASGDHIKIPNDALMNQIKNVREDFYMECKMYRENVKNILNAWKKLKQLRGDNGYSTTSIRLVINKQGNMLDDFEEALQEIINEQENEYRKNLEYYKKELSKWKRNVENEEEIKEERPMKPTRNASVKELRLQLEASFEKSFGSNEEPTLSFSVTYSNEITKTSGISNEEEKLRRLAVGNSKIYLKLFWNDIEICKTKSVKLNDNFTLNFEECFSLKLEKSVQEYMKIQVIEQIGLSRKTMCTMTITVPKQTRSKVEEITFEKQIEPKPTKFGHKAKVYKISGFLNYCVGWISDSETIISSEHKNKDIMNSDGSLNAVKLREWINTNKPDPEDPRNTIVFDYLKEHQNGTTNQSTTKYFRCDPYLEPFTICTKEQIEDNIRLQLLQLRDKNEPEFVGMMVPNRLKEIPSNVFVSYKRRLAEEKYREYFEEADGLDDIVTKRSLGRKYLRQIHTKVFQICRNFENNLCFEDVVNEKMVPWIQMYLTTIIANVFNWFKFIPSPSVPLPRPQQAESPNQEESVTGNACNVNKSTQAKLIIHLKNGQNLPTPTTRQSQRTSSGSRKISPKSRSTTPESTSAPVHFGKYYAEIVYENKTVTSAFSSGENPTWNEILIISLVSSNIDYLSPNSLSGNVYVNLFEQIEVREKNTSTDLWLGEIVIPISATALENKLEGYFALKTPQYIFGYEKDVETHTPSAGTPRTHQPKSLSLIEMSLCIEPTIPKICADLGSIVSSEPPFLRDHILSWNKRFNDDHPKRKISALAINSHGRTVCITRFIKRLEPPQLNPDGFDVTPEQCARYVSLIPITNVNKFYQNVWLSADQILKLGLGSITDLAVLLTCYLLSLNLEVWLLIGYGIPHGHTAYVLEREYVNEIIIPNHFIIDVSTGMRYNVIDTQCPLLKVFCVVNETNIWGNVQRGDVISTTRFDLTRRFDWQPLFSNQISSPSNSIQHKLHYLSTGNTEKLQVAIEKKLRKKISKSRSQDVTIWNHYVSNLLKTQLNKAAKNFIHNKTNLGMISELVEFTRNYKLNGFIELLPFSNMNDVVEFILQTKVHQVTGSNVEFASSVQVQSFSNQIIAIWIAFVTIFKE